uniref:RNA exonuclease 4 n=1 Tax=Aegilops tauschii subsp. strangulata TaxID=200361 RepID=A0A453DXS4_AEGTS
WTTLQMLTAVTGARRATGSSTGWSTWWSTCGRRTTPATSHAAASAASTAAPSTPSATTSASAPPCHPSQPAPPPSKPTAARSASPSSPPPPPSAPTAPHASSPAGGAVALGCKMVGGGSDGTLDVCARVCVVDEHEAILYESFVKPLIPVTHYRYESTGIRPEHLRDAPTVKQATRRIQDILLNGEQSYYSSRGAARLLVGHGLEHDLDALGMDYPAHLRRDTAAYPPLMKTSARLMSNSLRYLTRSCLGYDIQTGGHHHPYDDCVAAMR